MFVCLQGRRRPAQLDQELGRLRILHDIVRGKTVEVKKDKFRQDLLIVFVFYVFLNLQQASRRQTVDREWV
jgi:hypothetical protein